MITLAQDAELLTNLVSANPVPATKQFFVFNDELKHPAILSRSSDDKLELIINIDGRPHLRNLGNIWGLSGHVQACALLQDEDLTVSIAVATGADNGKSQFYLIHNVKPADLLNYASDNIAKASDLFPEIHGIYISNFTRKAGTKTLPLLFLAFQPRDRITAENQLAYVNIKEDDSGTVQLSLNTTWKLAVNPLSILDVTFGTCRLGQGAFVLYKTTTGLKLQFRVFEGRNFTVDFDAPSGATCLTSYVDPDKKSSVFLVGGDKITKYTYDEYKKAKATGTALSTGPPSGLKDIHTDRNGDQITIWFTTTLDAAYYYAASTNSIDDGALVQLLQDGEGGRLSSLLYSDDADGDSESTLVKTLLSVDESGNLTMLQQASDTNMWKAHPLYVSDEGNNVKVNCFTVRIKVASDAPNDENQHTSGCSLHINMSGYVRVLRNGKAAVLSQTGDWFEADLSGTVMFIMPTADISCHTLTIDQFRAPNGHATPLKATVINPSSKAVANLASIKTGQDLLNAKTQCGKNLITPGTVSQADADKAADMIQQLYVLHTSLESGSSGSQPSTPDGDAAVKVAVQADADSESSDSDPSPWDFFFFLYKKAKDVGKWFLKAYDDVVHFVCEWAGKAYHFVLDTLSAIGKAISWLFEKVKVGIQAIIDFVGFLFNWDFILTYSDSIVALCNAGLDHGMARLDELDTEAQDFIDDISARLKGRQQPAAVSTTADSASGKTTDTGDDVHRGVGFNWSSYQLHHGGFVESLPGEKANSTSSDDDPLQDVYNDLIGEVHTVTRLMHHVGDDFTGLFNGQCSSSDFFNQITDDIIDSICDSLRNLVDAFLKCIKFILKSIKTMGNATINIPIFTALWKKLTNGRDFTLFNCVALITAVPASVLHKMTVVCRKDPPKLSGKVTEAVFKQYVENDSALDAELSKEILLVASMAGAAVGVLSVEVGVVAYMMSQVADLPDGKGTVVSPWLGNLVDCVMVNITTLGLIFSWPLKSQLDLGLRWPIWFLKLSNGLFTVVTRIVGYKTKTSRVITKRFVSVFELYTGIAMYALQMTLATDEYKLADNDPDKDDTSVTLHVVAETIDLVGCAAFLVAALADGVNPPVSEAGLVAWILCTSLAAGVQLADVSLWGKKFCKC